MSKGTKTPHALIAVTRDETDFRAVEVRKHGQAVEIAWTRSAPAAGGSWSDFAAQCGFSPNASGRSSSAPAVVGLDMSSVAFYRIDAPHVSQEETASIVRMQAESFLPLPPDQIELAWRTMPSTNGKVDVAMAAARRDVLVKFAEQVRDFRPRSILLACEGTARAWLALFGGQEHQAVLVSLGANQTQLTFVIDGLVANAAVVDTGTAELAGAQPPSIEITERFTQDVRTAMSSFGWKEPEPWSVVILSDGREAMERVAGMLQAGGLSARTCTPASTPARAPSGFGVQEVYEYRTAIGLALLGLDAAGGGLDLFDQIVRAEQQKKDQIARHSTWLAAALAAVALIVLIAASYAIDVTKERRLSNLVNQAGFEEARQRQILLRILARNRPDVLDMLTEINVGENPGIVLETLHFKKGQLITIVGQADNQKQMSDFQKHLLKSKSLSAVDILPGATRDSKTNKVKFTMNFHYKNFTKKESAL
jgi:hypothetical protein